MRARTAGDVEQAWSEVTALAEQEPNANVPGSYRDDENSWKDFGLTGPLKPSAVLVPLIERAAGITVLLTRRTENLSSHSGQISFPGGRVEQSDAAPVHTALRESEEEIGLEPARVEILGRLANYVVGTGYRITPVVGFVDAQQEFVRDEREVAEIFEVPLELVMEPDNYRREHMRIKNINRSYYVLPYGEYRIWGATASILLNLRDTLSG
ncbi:MAG: CoA pyrophosphatase [Rhodospirillaceae bacterium]|nr:CoA pyrophosphatase [Rhodospirillaceae bacterium]MBT3627104.1 CoA pyrophosphatase [Rhodospirillaceae bacterium]MBT3926193.1 CoA pyrophosphatase [Rhodospirillaceae bacterium]MBT4425860.1 CoA pyrophosphatase [Rhodospirillaceae bacterium]MBT5039130.1 CoA pyrophosphatase [Rhodospirillaceae bacterium]